MKRYILNLIAVATGLVGIYIGIGVLILAIDVESLKDRKSSPLYEMILLWPHALTFDIYSGAENENKASDRGQKHPVISKRYVDGGFEIESDAGEGYHKANLSGDSVIKDIYSDELQVLNGWTVGGRHLIQVVARSKVETNEGSHQIFLTAANKVDEHGPQTCHACSPKLGIAVYELNKKADGHYQYNLYASNPNVGEIGGFGRLFGYNDEIKSAYDVMPNGDDGFFLVLNYTTRHQGAKATVSEFVTVEPIGMDASIHKVGSLKTAEGSCGFGKKESYVDGKLEIYESPVEAPDMCLYKTEYACSNGQELSSSVAPFAISDGELVEKKGEEAVCGEEPDKVIRFKGN